MKAKVIIGWSSAMVDSTKNDIEDKINEWLTANPNVEVVSVHFSANLQTGTTSGSTFAGICLILYKDAAK